MTDDKITLRVHQPGDMGWIVSRHGALYAQEYDWNSELEALVAEIARLGERYREELANLSPEELVLEQLLNAREEGLSLFHQVIAVIFGRFHRSTHEDIAARTALLEPLSAHVAAFEAASKAGQPCEDVDPDAVS